MVRRNWMSGLLIGVVAGAVAAGAETKPFTLVRAVPDDVFICATGHYNPERQFLYDYWSDVADAFLASGITEDVLSLLTTQLDEQQRAEFDRIWDRFGGICRSIDWEQLDRGEFVFAERMTVFSEGSANVRGAFPNIVVMVRADESASNYNGLVEMFEAAAEEINGLSGSNVLRVVESEKYDAEIHSVNLLGSVPGAPSMEFALTRRGDVIVFSLGGELLEDVLARLADDSAGGRLADDPRFVSAFQQLPEAEDSMVFFDMQNMLRPLEQMFRSIALRARGPGDVTRNTGLNAKASQKNAEALNAYLHGEYQQAYELANAARQLEPRDSLVLYNLACFSALVGKRNDALDWLEKAVEAGFYAPSKIASDSDLASLRGDPRFEELVSRAAELARLHSARDIVVNSSRTSEAYRITTQGWQACDRGEYEEALKLAEQALALAPDDPRPRYLAACAHARLGHADQALGDLRKAVDAGFYCPQHISDDPDLASVRERPEYAQALEAARRGAAAHGADDTDTYESLFLNLMTRIMRSARVVDCIAAVEYTEGYTTHQDSIAMLAPDAADDPLYSVFVRGGTVTQFDRFLPRETESFSVSAGFSLEAFYAYLQTLVGDAGPAGKELLAQWDAVQEQIGFDVERDVLSWLGNEFTSVTLADGAGSVMIISVKDEQLAREKTEAAVRMLSEGLSQLAASQPMFQMFSVIPGEPADERLEGFQSLQFMLAPGQPVVCGVRDGHLIIGAPESAVALCVQTAADEHPGIRDNERAMSELLPPSDACVMVSLTDYRDLGKQLAAGIAMAGSFVPMVAMAIPEPEGKQAVMKIGGMVGKLAPVVRKIDFYKSTASTTSFDGKAWRTRSVTHYLAPEERGVPSP